MNTYQIDEILYADKHTRTMYRGAFSWDQVPDLDENTCCVANTDCSELPGKHWVFYVHKYGKLIFFDSYGQHPKSYPGLPAKVDDFNRKQVQQINTTTCGQWCVYVILNIARGFSIVETLKPFKGDLHANDHFVCEFVNDRYDLDLEVHSM